MANYFIMGADSQEYGPASVDELRKWVAEGRADGQSKVRREGTTDWLPLAQVRELAQATMGKTPAPPIHPQPPAARTSSMAVASLVLGILGLFSCGSTALFGLILGIIAMVRVTKSRGALTGKGLALAGVVVSGVFLLLLPAMLAMTLPALAAAKQRAQQISCMNNERQLAQAVRLYSTAHANHFPPAATWCDAIHSNVSSDAWFKCPAAPAMRCGYAFNARLDGVDASQVNPRTVLLFDAEGDWNAHGGLAAAAARHRGHMVNVAFADGHVEAVSDNELGALRWEP